MRLGGTSRPSRNPLPNMSHREHYFSGHDGLRLYQQVWLPGGEATAVVLIVHGFTEHSGRYQRTAEELCCRGYGVYAMDVRGHGRSEGARCFVRSFDDYLLDLDLFVEGVRRREPGKPLFLFGHCLGGLIAALWSITRQPQLQGLVLSAPTLRLQNDLFPLLRRLAAPVGWLFPRLRLVRMGSANISSDPAVVAQFRADPLVFHDRFPVRTGSEVLRAIRRASRSLEAVRLPLLVLHGTTDRVCQPGGSRELCRRAESSDKILHLYEGFYHEVLNEPQREQVVKDLLHWLDARR